jgi:CRISPR/Cas system-associated protein Cas5 (RAMP superfamily)
MTQEEKELLTKVVAHDAALCATLREIKRIIFVEMPGQNLEFMGEKYHTKIKKLIDAALTNQTPTV